MIDSSQTEWMDSANSNDFIIAYAPFLYNIPLSGAAAKKSPAGGIAPRMGTCYTNFI